jgi:hypothetical protein
VLSDLNAIGINAQGLRIYCQTSKADSTGMMADQKHAPKMSLPATACVYLVHTISTIKYVKNAKKKISNVIIADYSKGLWHAHKSQSNQQERGYTQDRYSSSSYITP